MSGALLEVENLAISFGALRAVSDLSFSAEHGRITSVIGPNGAGKSTLFNLVSGALAPQRGCVSFAGADVTGWPTNRLLRAGLSRIPLDDQIALELSYFESLTTREIATVLEIPENTVRSRLSRARDKLRVILAELGTPDEVSVAESELDGRAPQV